MKWREIFKIKFLVFIFVSFLTGIVFARYISFTNEFGIIWWLIIIFVLSHQRFTKLSKLSLICVFCLAGVWRGTVYMLHLDTYNQLLKHDIIIIAKARNDAIYSTNSQLEFDVDGIKIIQPTPANLVGVIAVRGYGTSMVYKGDLVQVSSKLYVTRGSRQALMSYSKIALVERDQSLLNNFRRKYVAALHSVVPEPLSSFGLGLLIGQRTTLPKDLNQRLSKVGLTHIVAVSGYNLTIIVQLVLRIFKNKSRYQTTAVTVLFIGMFMVVTGFSASIVRASVVSLLSIWAWLYGRKLRALVVLLLSACITSGFYPIYLWSDTGWHLSYLAFFGVLVVGPVFTLRFYKKNKPKIFAQLLIETVSAQVMTIPIVLYIFGKLSLVAILANILVVPIVSVAMGLCFLSGLIGLAIPSIAGWFTWPTVLVLNYMLDVTKMISQIPMATVSIRFTLIQTVITYLVIMFVCFLWWNKLTLGDKIKV